MIMPFSMSVVPGDDGITVHVGGKCMYFEHVEMEDMIEAHDKYHNRGLYIQDAYDFLSPGQREFLMTGLLPSEFEALFDDDGYDEDEDWL